MAQRAKRSAKAPRRKPNRASAAAPATHLAFSTQETVLAHRLLSAPRGSVLSLEVIDDIGIASADGTTTALQAKSALVTNPISDHAIAFWKTFANWLKLLDDGLLDLNATFVLYVSKATNGPIAESFAAAKSLNEAQSAVAAAKAAMSHAAQRSVNKKLPQDLAKHVQVVLDDPRLPMMLTRFELQFGSGSPIADFQNELAKQLVLQDVLQGLGTHILGWVKERVAVLLEQQRPAFIARDEFSAEMSAFIGKLRVNSILLSYARAPTSEQTEEALTRLFIRQLELIGLGDEDFLAAVSDFLMASVNRVEWAARGLIHESSFDELDSDLRTTWQNNRVGANAMHPDAAARCGQHLFSECMKYQTPLQGIVAPTGFVRGCFHALADALTIGWHPKYKTILQRKVVTT